MKRAVVPGTFDPITAGHVDVISRAAQIFDEVVVAVAASVKKKPLFDQQKRVELTKKAVMCLPNVSVISFDGLLVDCVDELDAHVVVKGLRAITDFEYEFQMTALNYELKHFSLCHLQNICIFLLLLFERWHQWVATFTVLFRNVLRMP